MYNPQPGDFEFLTARDLEVDRNFASQGYWRGVAIHFLRNRFAMTGVNGRAIVAKILSPQWAGARVSLIIDPRIRLASKEA